MAAYRNLRSVFHSFYLITIIIDKPSEFVSYSWSKIRLPISSII